MSGTRKGGMKTKETIIKYYGKDFFKEIGHKGGSVSGIAKGFALMPKEKVQEAGRKGGKISKRGKSKKNAYSE